MSARHIIADALSERREQLTGESSFMDNDGARLVLKRLEEHGFAIVVPADLLESLRSLKAKCWTSVEKRAVDDCIALVTAAVREVDA